MAKEKKRGFFSWLGFGQKEQPEEPKVEAQDVVSPAEPEVEVVAVAQQVSTEQVEQPEIANAEPAVDSPLSQDETTQKSTGDEAIDSVDGSAVETPPQAIVAQEDVYQADQQRIVTEEVAAIESLIAHSDVKTAHDATHPVDETAEVAAAQEQIVIEEVAAIEELLPRNTAEENKAQPLTAAEVQSVVTEPEPVIAPRVAENLQEAAPAESAVEEAEPVVALFVAESPLELPTVAQPEAAAAEPVVAPLVAESLQEAAPVESAVEEAEPVVAPFVAESPLELPTAAQPEVAAAEPVVAPLVTESLQEAAPAELVIEEAEAAEAEPVVAVPIVEQEKPTKEGFFARLKRSLVKTKQNLGSGFMGLFRGKKIDDDLFEELEEQLLIADVGVDTTRKIISKLTETASRKQLHDAEALYSLLKEEMREILLKVDSPLKVEGKTPFVILMVGVNGVGKTTTIGKLARQFELEGKSVMLAAGDTFRAAAVEQLQVWGDRNNIPVIAQHTGADSASVIFDAIQAAKARNVDVLIADTAGRLQNKAHLMEELKKIVRVMKKLDEEAPHEIMLTLDASTGQNAISQAKLFHEAVGLTGITLTKLDGTAKGGVIFSIADQFSIPIRYIGVGEQLADLRPFNSEDFIEALFARED